jgi:hypothetical protein
MLTARRCGHRSTYQTKILRNIYGWASASLADHPACSGAVTPQTATGFRRLKRTVHGAVGPTTMAW